MRPSAEMIEAEVRAFLHQSAPAVGEKAGEIAAGAWLWDYFESLSLLELVEYLEGRFKIEIAPLELTPEGFGTIRQIVALVDSHQPT